uniref:Uncharacterized protein n=1 Tax=Timema poppense TaxID=170557 RepID=A0A7R9CVV5_TIMPO|nr:unnamed protein product [Timema poppensis]
MVGCVDWEIASSGCKQWNKPRVTSLTLNLVLDKECSSSHNHRVLSSHSYYDRLLREENGTNKEMTSADENFSKVRDLFRSWREENVRRSLDVVDLWETVLAKKINALGDEIVVVMCSVLRQWVVSRQATHQPRFRHMQPDGTGRTGSSNPPNQPSKSPGV